MLSQKSKEKKGNPKVVELPVIPEKLYFTIGEVATLCTVKTHVLRYWEQEFVQLNPTKRRGNRRYYQRKEVLLIRRIRELLYEQGYTIEGAKQQLQDKWHDKVNGTSEKKSQQKQRQVDNKIIEETIQRLQQLVLELES